MKTKVWQKIHGIKAKSNAGEVELPKKNTEKCEQNEYLKLKIQGAPGWLSQWSVQLFISGS